MKYRDLAVLGVFFVGLTVVAQPQKDTKDVRFAGTYEELQPAQKKIVDEWYAEYDRVVGDHLSPSEYDKLPVSTRTTFEAVTHALLATDLTDTSGRSFGNALNIVQGVETVSGKIPKASGDLQFRIYVLLTPAALDTLKHSKQFYRDHDNTVFHKGYPICYRQGGGDPSIQVSVSKDGRHADIDVDYRSSRFPFALFNGHLTAANSDVRAGNNTERHDKRWLGLTDWWRNLFGLPGQPEETFQGTQEGDIPLQPRKGAAKVDDAVQDFLTAWLMEKRPEIAAAYLSPRSFSCLEEYATQAGSPVNGGLAPYVAAKEMAATVKLIGKINNLQDAVGTYPIKDTSFKTIKQQNNVVFSLAEVTNRVATELDCDPQRAYDEFDRFRSAGSLDTFGGYYASTFRLRAPNETSDGITLLWTKEQKIWKIVAWDIESEERKSDNPPDTRSHKTPVASVSKATDATVQTSPEFQRAASGFFDAWLLKESFLEAASYFSSKCFECINLYLASGELPPSSAESQASYIQNSLEAMGKEIGPIHHLKDALEPVSPEHEGLRLIRHSNQGAYSLVAVPDYLADAFECTKHSVDNPYRSSDTDVPKYGTYYASLFRLRTPGEHSATATLLWKVEDGQWKIIAYEVID